MQSKDILTPLLVNLIDGLHPLLWLLGPQKATHSCFDATHSVAFPLSLILYILYMSPFYFSCVLISYSFSHCSIGSLPQAFFIHTLSYHFPIFISLFLFFFLFHLSYSHVFIYSPVLAWAWLFSCLWESHARELWQQNKFILIPTYENSHTNLYSRTNLHSGILLVIQWHFVISEPSIDYHVPEPHGYFVHSPSLGLAPNNAKLFTRTRPPATSSWNCPYWCIVFLNYFLNVNCATNLRASVVVKAICASSSQFY